MHDTRRAALSALYHSACILTRFSRACQADSGRCSNATHCCRWSSRFMVACRRHKPIISHRRFRIAGGGTLFIVTMAVMPNTRIGCKGYLMVWGKNFRARSFASCGRPLFPCGGQNDVVLDVSALSPTLWSLAGGAGFRTGHSPMKCSATRRACGRLRCSHR
jgi:hypothetical protein